VTVTDGVVTGVTQTKEGELPALLGAPATVLGTYTNALGQVFSSLTSLSGDQQKLLQQQISTAVTQNQATTVAAVQLLVCRRAVASYDFSKMDPLSTATAAAAIKAACSGM
jgi:hypothetical protein